MKLNQQDIAVIEQALQEAMNNVSDYQAISAYQDVLNKVRVDGTEPDVSMRNETGQVDATDGFRHDYDDSSNL